MILKITGIITLLVQSDRKPSTRKKPVSRPDVLYFVRDSSSEYLVKYNNQDILFVGEESCTDKRNTPYICSDAFYKLAVLLMDEYSLPESGSPTEPLPLFQEIYKLVADT